MRLGSIASALYRRFFRGDQVAGYQLAEGLTRFLSPQYRFMEFGRSWTHDEGFVDTYRRVVGDRLLHTADKKWFLRELARSVRDRPGHLAECGSLRGASAYFIAEGIEGTGKDLHLFDSWRGLSEPTHVDGEHWSAGDLAASEASCRATLEPFEDRVHTHAGWIPERFPDVAHESFCLVHVDVDLYQPHRDTLDFFWPRLSQGGLMVFDDYGSDLCPGARRAVDEFFASRPDVVIGVPTGQAFVIKR